MPYFLLDAQGRPVGPYTREELEFFAQRGVVGQDTLVVLDQVENTVPLERIFSLPASASGLSPGLPDRHLPLMASRPGAAMLWCRVANRPVPVVTS